MSSPDNRVLADDEVTQALADLPGWTHAEGRLRRTFKFADFADAWSFMCRSAFDAERLVHHPNWSNVYSTVEVELWSHDLGGVSQLCVELATAMQGHAARFGAAAAAP